jgi:hypothetical protein
MHRSTVRGEYEDVEKKANEAYARHNLMRESADSVAQLALIFDLGREQGRLGERVGVLGALIHGSPHLAPIRGDLAISPLESDREVEAEALLDEIANDGIGKPVGKVAWRSALALLHLSMLATTWGRWREAEVLLEEAMAHCAALDSPPWRLRTQLASARRSLARNQPGHLEKARSLLGARGLRMPNLESHGSSERSSGAMPGSYSRKYLF